MGKNHDGQFFMTFSVGQSMMTMSLASFGQSLMTPCSWVITIFSWAVSLTVFDDNASLKKNFPLLFRENGRFCWTLTRGRKNVPTFFTLQTGPFQRLTLSCSEFSVLIKIQNHVAFQVSRCGQGGLPFRIKIRNFPSCSLSRPVDFVCPNSTSTTLQIYTLTALCI